MDFPQQVTKMSSILADQLRPRIWAQMRGGGEVPGSQPMSTAVQYTGAQINFVDLTLYLTYDFTEDTHLYGDIVLLTLCKEYFWEISKIHKYTIKQLQ